MDRFDELLGHAFSKVAGGDANQTLWDVRAELEREHANVVCYELVLGREARWEELLDVHLPRLTEHFLAKGLPLLGGASAIVALWRAPAATADGTPSGDLELHLFRSPQLFSAIARMDGLTEVELGERLDRGRAALGLDPARRPLGLPRS